ncbi:MAG: glycosyltransferase [Patescibacteria group bacterium]|nr:glycosyltransferase [Patescibacteria group bacterium]
MKNPKVSVIIPVYNRGEKLKGCLKSVLNQTYKDYEVIVVDNNSTDNTKETIKEFQKKDKRVRYLFEPKRGAAAARYLGEINSQGEIILMTDSDCIVKENWVAEIIEPIVKRGAVAVQGVKRAAIKNYWTLHMEEDERRNTAGRVKDKKMGLLDTATFAIKKSVLEKIGLTNPRLSIGHDTELEARFKIQGYEIFLKQVEVLHYYADNAIKLFKKMFIRGYWNARITKTYGAYKKIFFIQSKMEHLRYFIRVGLELLYLHKNFKYDLVAGVGWRIGLVCGYIWKKIK